MSAQAPSYLPRFSLGGRWLRVQIQPHETKRYADFGNNGTLARRSIVTSRRRESLFFRNMQMRIRTSFSAFHPPGGHGAGTLRGSFLPNRASIAYITRVRTHTLTVSNLEGCRPGVTTGPVASATTCYPELGNWNLSVVCLLLHQFEYTVC